MIKKIKVYSKKSSLVTQFITGNSTGLLELPLFIVKPLIAAIVMQLTVKKIYLTTNRPKQHREEKKMGFLCSH